jgi:hypothetical protein
VGGVVGLGEKTPDGGLNVGEGMEHAALQSARGQLSEEVLGRDGVGEADEVLMPDAPHRTDADTAGPRHGDVCRDDDTGVCRSDQHVGLYTGIPNRALLSGSIN